MVVEAAQRSGALRTAQWAGDLDRPLFAVPGPVTSTTAQGPHQLIRHGQAALVSSPADVSELLSARRAPGSSRISHSIDESYVPHPTRANQQHPLPAAAGSPRGHAAPAL